jgi:hypothetical protein
VAQLTQIRDLRSSLEEAEADIAMLQTAKYNLEKRLEAIGDEFISANQGKMIDLVNLMMLGSNNSC